MVVVACWVENQCVRCVAPSYRMEPSPMSKEGQGFIVASGGEIPNECKFQVPSMSAEGVWSNHLWQVASVTQPLLSIGEAAEAGKYLRSAQKAVSSTT